MMPQGPMSSAPPQGGPWSGPGGAPFPQAPPPPQPQYFSMTGGINPNYQGNAGISNQADANGVVYHGNPIATFMTTPGGQQYQTYDQAVAGLQGGGPGGPPAPPQDGGRGRGGGGGGRGKGQTPEVPTGDPNAPGTTNPYQGGQIWDMPPETQAKMASTGHGAQIADVLRRIGLVPGGFTGQYGFPSSWLMPANFQFTPEMYALFAGLEPADQQILQEILAESFSFQLGAGGVQVPGTPQIPGMPTQPGVGGPPGTVGQPVMPDNPNPITGGGGYPGMRQPGTQPQPQGPRFPGQPGIPGNPWGGGYQLPVQPQQPDQGLVGLFSPPGVPQFPR